MEAESGVETLSLKLQPQFIQFASINSIPIDSFDVNTIYRFIRINPRLLISVEDLQKQCKEISLVPWFPEFYQLPSDIKLSQLEAYENGHIYGIDVSSGAVVKALDLQVNDNVLDLCCAPGAKLCYIADQIYPSGTVTGVDISFSRLSTCRNICKKYNISNVRLFEADGTEFNILAPNLTSESNSLEIETLSPSDSDPHEEFSSLGEISIFDSEFIDQLEVLSPPSDIPEFDSQPIHSDLSPWQRRKRRKLKYQNDLPDLFYSSNWKMRSSAVSLYDKVLVDAPCTLDASIRHILEYNKVGWKIFDENISEQLAESQKKILRNAFRLLKTGGILVYSTCSFCKNQNEDVVQWLIQNEPAAQLVPILFSHKTPATTGSLQHTLRFYPKWTGTSGMFIAKIIKKDIKEISNNFILNK